MKYLRVAVRLLALILIFVSFAIGLGLLLPLQRLWKKNSEAIGDITRFHLRSMCRVIGLRIHWRGPALSSEPYLVLANHVSYLDILAIGSKMPVTFMAKKEVARWPMVGYLSRQANAVFVKRECTRERLTALREAARLVPNQCLCIFPEGTTTHQIRPRRDSWSRGNIYLARHAARKTYCLALHYSDHSRIAWIDDQSLLPHLIQTLKRPFVDLYAEYQILEDSSDLSLGDLSLKAHKTVCRLADTAAARSRQDSTVTHLDFRFDQKIASSHRAKTSH